MGQVQSGEFEDAVDEVEQDLVAQEGRAGIKLYSYVRAGSAGKWELMSGDAHPLFYDCEEDSGKTRDYHMEIDAGDIDVRVDQSMDYLADLGQRRITFSANGEVYALRFPNADKYKEFCKDLTDYVFWNTYGKENDEENRAKELGADYADMFFSDASVGAGPMDLDPEPEGPERVPDNLNESKALEREEEEEMTIHGIVMGELENNYLMRGNKIDVLRNVDGGGVLDKGITFSLSTPQGKGGAGVSFTPSKALLAQGERRMNLLTPDNRSRLHQADIETGKIISTWTFAKDGVEIPMGDISHDTKASAAEEKSTFLGLDNNRLCRWDLRDARGVVQESPFVNYEPGGKDYSRGTNFTCMATSGEGYVVVGSKDGKIRMYNNKSLTKANTAIPGLGAPITSVDVTYDGKWVVATTDHYLMVVKTTYTSDKGATMNAFSSRMGARGAMPRLLRLRPEDQSKTGGRPFMKGKFTWITEQGHSERWIVASCGKFSVVWNFSKIKTSSAETLSFGGLPTCMDYVITAKNEEVVDAAFVHQRYITTPTKGGVDATSFVVATPHSLFNVGGAS